MRNFSHLVEGPATLRLKTARVISKAIGVADGWVCNCNYSLIEPVALELRVRCSRWNLRNMRSPLSKCKSITCVEETIFCWSNFCTRLQNVVPKIFSKILFSRIGFLYQDSVGSEFQMNWYNPLAAKVILDRFESILKIGPSIRPCWTDC